MVTCVYVRTYGLAACLQDMRKPLVESALYGGNRLELMAQFCIVCLGEILAAFDVTHMR